MSKAFTVKVFEGWITTTSEIYVDAALAPLLGTADEVKFQANITDYSGASPTLVVTYYSGCDNVFFNSEHAYTSGVISAVTQLFWTATSMVVNGGFGKVGLKMGQGSTKVYVQLFVTGRTA